MLELMIAALVAGAVAGLTGVATDAIKDAYAGLKGMLASKFGKTKGAIDALEDDPKDEDAQKLVTKRLTEANAVTDADVQAAANKLVAALKAAGISLGSVSQSATGDGNVQIAGSGNTVTSNVSKGNTGITVQGSAVHGDVVQGDKVGGDKIGRQINTGDGTYVEHDLSTGRDFVGRDSVVNNYYGRASAADTNTAVSPLGQKLAHMLTSRFSLGELNGVCFDLGVNKDELSGQTLSERAQELVLLCERRKRIAALRAVMLSARDDLQDEL